MTMRARDVAGSCLQSSCCQVGVDRNSFCRYRVCWAGVPGRECRELCEVSSIDQESILGMEMRPLLISGECRDGESAR